MPDPRKTLLVLAALAGLWLTNTSLFTAPRPGASTRSIAHRGVHQTFSAVGLSSESCTATRIHPPTHDLLENTLPSMQAAFDAGADVVELDVHLTPDRELAVFHDRRLECRTNGHGVTEQRPMTHLRTLDIGHGYTTDGGATFPFRGKAKGAMPTLAEVLARFPGRRFLVNFKSQRAEEGDAVASLAKQAPAFAASIWAAYGGYNPTVRMLALMPDARGYTRASLEACGLRYLALGWTGYVPSACRHTLLVLPSNFAAFAWGWPHRLTARLRAVGTEIILAGAVDVGDAGGVVGIDDIPTFDAAVPAGFDGYVWTNRIEVIGPHLRRSMPVARGEER
jgi:glycerophosphoryl diester phosphodiesterase